MSYGAVNTRDPRDAGSDSRGQSTPLRDLLRSFLPLALSLSSCGASVEPPPPPARPCPSVAPLASIAPATSVSATPTTSVAPTAVAGATPAPQPYKLLWFDVWEGGEVLVRTHPAGIALIPAFLATEVEGGAMAVLDAAGLARWEKTFDGVGAAGAAVAPDGSIVTIAVDTLSWPKTTEAYEMRRIATTSADGKKTRSFRLPSTAQAESISIDAAGKLLVTGMLTGRATFGKGIELAVHGDDKQGFVARLDADGHAEWARGLAGTLTVRPASEDKVLLLQTVETGGALRQKLLFGDGKGHEDWTLDTTPSCQIRSIFATPTRITAVATPGCFDPPPLPPPTEERCALFHIDAATGKVTSTVALPGCAVWADARGMAVVSDETSLTLLDAAGKPLWTTTLVVPPGCLYRGYATSGVALDATSVYVAGRCMGDRIGTMFNSPYSRAYGRATTYVGRYDRR